MNEFIFASRNAPSISLGNAMRFLNCLRRIAEMRIGRLASQAALKARPFGKSKNKFIHIASDVLSSLKWGVQFLSPFFL